MRITFLALILIFSYIHPAFAQMPSVAAYGKLPEKSMFVISPSGNLVAYRQKTEKMDVINIIDLSKGKVANSVSVFKVNPESIFFVSENNLILRVSRTMTLPGYIGKHNVNAAYSYNLDTKKLHQIMVPGKGVYSGQADVASIIGVSDDGKSAYMPAYSNESRYSLLRVRLDRFSEARVSDKGSSDSRQFFLDDSNQVIAREKYNNKKNLHRIESKLGGKWETIYEQEVPFISTDFRGLTPDRKNLVMLAVSPETERWAYYTMSLADGSVQGPFFNRADKDVEDILLSFDGIVHGVRYSGFEPEYEFFDEKLNRRMRGIKKALPDLSISIRDYTPDWSNIILYAEGKDNSGQYLMYDDGRLDYLAAARPDIQADQVNDVIEYRYTARDGLEIPTLLTAPRGKEIKNLPAIMMPHGGPEAYDTKGFDYQAQYFASQGYLVIQPQFRGSDGFGLDHLLAGRGEWGRKMQDDLTDAIITLADEGKVDKERVCIVGGSYGGYAALAGAVFTPDLYKCVVSLNGVSDVHSMLNQDKKDYGKHHWVVSYWETVIAKGEVEKDHLKQISPINHISEIKAPVLLIHGQYDKVVSKEQSKKMAKRMKRAKKNVTYIELPKGDHYLSSGKNRMTAMEAIAKFVDEHI